MENSNEIGKLYTVTSSSNEEQVRETFLRLNMGNSGKAVMPGVSGNMGKYLNKEVPYNYYHMADLGKERVSTDICDCNGKNLYLGDMVEFYSMMAKICTRRTKHKKGRRNKQAPPFYKVLVPEKHFGIISINDTPSYKLERGWDDSLVVVEDASRPTGPFIIKADNGRAYDVKLNTEELEKFFSWCYNWDGISGNMDEYVKIKKIG